MAGPIIRADPVTAVLLTLMRFRRRAGSPSPASRLGLSLALCLLAAGTALPASAAPFTPTDDQQVLASVPARERDPRARELAALRKAWQAAPQDIDAALALTRGCIAELLARGDPRHAGCAQAALAPWWPQAAPPPAVRVERAVLLQFEHRFDAALADLDAALLAEIEGRRGQAAAAEAAFREALALDWPDVYLRAAYADLLLDLNRAPEVLTLLERDAGSDLLLLRLAEAGAAARDPRAARWSDELSARFAAARQRGDTTHRKEEARF
ncbi:MAG: hypothetical protein RL227_1710, partial [Pseudomonadota bacterium]